ELSMALLKNIANETQEIVDDRVEISSIYMESQALNYSVKAHVQADNREIELSLDVSLSRSFVEKTSISIEMSKYLKDPLVISLDGMMPTLSSKTFSFDIDSDGKSDQISQLNAASGFLALDKNSNGIIDNGSELFGTASGDGFRDLSKYDDDKNGWIDENDAIFNKLRVWQKSEGKDELIALGEVGIGALFLGSTSTPFTLKSDSNELLAEIRESGFFLFESAKAGVISQIDLAVSPATKDSLIQVDDLQKDISIHISQDAYKESQVDSDKSGDSDKRMKELQSKIKELEGKLRQADEADKPAIQAQIGEVFSQMMAILEEQINL
ncbi:MAG: hypothetical protein U9Q40_11630, partial [Campylobacterota bacterium]|nr:hypothetical protein [Campylobacterota bacterium]